MGAGSTEHSRQQQEQQECHDRTRRAVDVSLRDMWRVAAVFGCAIWTSHRNADQGVGTTCGATRYLYRKYLMPYYKVQ